ncbi:MAG TPA: hypothetical protein QGF63_06555 [Alphaproteobacteria bacterium]|jgi:hypothetical protein|nr:hypothetical protein [Alphaproteobacteria bacterium]MDP7427976.1 hypothetical protein [Alphaproteobacteria bacterium]HJM49496.1 hypothetical protein [Alphaproteobacteria bacterium]
MSGGFESAAPLATIAAPYGREIRLEDLAAGELRLLRLRLREGRRHTVLDIDAETARAWGQAMLDWAGDTDI